MLKKILTITVAVLVPVLMLGCGQKVSEKLAEKGMEMAAKQDGKDVKVDLNTKDGGFSMTVKDEDGKDQKMEVKSSGDGDNFSMTMSGEGGNVTTLGGENAKIPETFPKDVPQYPGMTPTVVQITPEQQMFMVHAKTTDPVAKVAEFYKKQCADQGWTEQMNLSQDNMQMLSYLKDKRMLNVNVATEEGATVISLHTMVQE